MIRTVHARDLYAAGGREFICGIERRCEPYDGTLDLGLIVYEHSDGVNGLAKPVIFSEYPDDTPWGGDIRDYWNRVVRLAWAQFFRKLVSQKDEVGVAEAVLTTYLDFGQPYGAFAVTPPIDSAEGT